MFRFIDIPVILLNSDYYFLIKNGDAYERNDTMWILAMLIKLMLIIFSFSVCF